MSKELAFSVTMQDLELQTFRSGGAGGQNQNKRDTGVRLIHHPSGARAECREERSQLQNKKKALKRLSEDPKFIYWAHVKVGSIKSAEQWVEEQMDPKNIKVEVKDEKGRWTDE